MIKQQRFKIMLKGASIHFSTNWSISCCKFFFFVWYNSVFLYSPFILSFDRCWFSEFSQKCHTRLICDLLPKFKWFQNRWTQSRMFWVYNKLIILNFEGNYTFLFYLVHSPASHTHYIIKILIYWLKKGK